jgi:hypothetical protein
VIQGLHCIKQTIFIVKLFLGSDLPTPYLQLTRHYQPPTNCYQPPTNCYQPPINCYQPPTNCYQPSTNRLPTANLLPTNHSLITYQILLATLVLVLFDAVLICNKGIIIVPSTFYQTVNRLVMGDLQHPKLEGSGYNTERSFPDLW